MSDEQRAREAAVRRLQVQGENLARMSPDELEQFLNGCEPVDQGLASEVVTATRELNLRRN